MPEILTLTQTNFDQKVDIGALKTYYGHLWKAREAVPGFLGGQVWSQVDEPNHTLAIHRYRDEKAADSGSRSTVKPELMAERSHLPSEPVNVVRLSVAHDYGTLRDRFVQAPFLSTSMRVGEPGRGEEVLEDLKRVFVESVLISGFTGYLIGVNQALEEEVFGFASWESPEAFRASVPQGIIATVKLYGRAWSD